MKRLAHDRSFSNFDKCWPEVAGDVISRVAVEHVGMDVSVKFVECRSNRSRGIQAAQFVIDDEQMPTNDTGVWCFPDNAIHQSTKVHLHARLCCMQHQCDCFINDP